MSRIRRAAMFAICTAMLVLSITGSALADGGGGGSGSGGSGGGGGGTAPPPPPPATAAGASLSPSSLTFGPQAVGTRSTDQIVRLTNTGTGSLFINAMGSGGLDQLDFTRTNDQCIGISVAPGASCTVAIAFNPTATGTRTMTLSIIDNAPSSPQVITLTGTGTSVNGPTPLSIDTTGLACTAGVCAIGLPGDFLVKNFFFTNFGVLGQSTPPYTWALASGTLPAGLTLFPNGQIYGTATTVGTSTFTLKVTDAAGRAATQAFGLTISPQPPPLTPAQQSCQHAPGSTIATLTGPSIAGQIPAGQGVGDQSQLTACGGFTVVRASVRNVNLPNGTVLWVTLGGEPIGRLVLSNGAATMQAWTLPFSTLRKVSMLVYTQPPTGSLLQTPILSGPFL
jgi:hypothetical protein